MHAFDYQLLYIEKNAVNCIFIQSNEINNIDLARIAWQKLLFEGRDYRTAWPKDVSNRPFVHICQNLPCNSSDDW